jgi:hypothetical protein
MGCSLFTDLITLFLFLPIKLVSDIGNSKWNILRNLIWQEGKYAGVVWIQIID